MSSDFQVRSQCEIMTDKVLATATLAVAVAGGAVVAGAAAAILKGLSECPGGTALAPAVVVLTAPITISASLHFVNSIAHLASVILKNDLTGDQE